MRLMTPREAELQARRRIVRRPIGRWPADRGPVLVVDNHPVGRLVAKGSCRDWDTRSHDVDRRRRGAGSDEGKGLRGGADRLPSGARRAVLDSDGRSAGSWATT